MSTIEAIPAFTEPDPLITPEDARLRLEKLGYTTPDTWKSMLQNDRGSHETRALVYIAESGKPQDINDVQHNLFPEHYAQTPDDLAATQSAEQAAADGGWERFTR